IARHEEARSWEAYRPVIDGLVATIGARLEIVANGATDAFRAHRRAEIAQWERATYRSSLVTALAARLPIGVAAFIVARIVMFERSLHDELTTAMFAHAALFGASLPAVASLGRNLLDMAKHSVRFGAFASLLEAWPLPSGAARQAIPVPATLVWENASV